jgi:regulator of sigma E protease
MSIIYGLLGLSLLVFIHELGHFIAARALGVEVETFSIGMGPVLLRKKIKTTEYRLSLIPIGGYCGMKGQKDFQFALDNKLDEIRGEKGSFYASNPLRRIIIAVSGPLANFVFAIFAFALISLIGYSFYTSSNKIIIANEVYPELHSTAAEAGLKTGDRILAINNKNIHYFSDISDIVAISANKVLDITVDREGELFHFQVLAELDTSSGAGKIGIVNWVNLLITSIQSGSHAESIGFKIDDIITAVNGMETKNTSDLEKVLNSLKVAELDEPIQFSVKRGNENIVLETDSSLLNDIQNLGLQFEFFKVHTPKKNIFTAFYSGVKETFKMIALTFKGIGLLFKGLDPKEAVSGPLRITLMFGDTVKDGFAASFSIGLISALSFLALISISLCIMNLLPIPILDGGLILFATIELISNKQVSPKILYYVQFVGLFLILILFAFALFGDINFIFKN